MVARHTRTVSGELAVEEFQKQLGLKWDYKVVSDVPIKTKSIVDFRI